MFFAAAPLCLSQFLLCFTSVLVARVAAIAYGCHKYNYRSFTPISHNYAARSAATTAEKRVVEGSAANITNWAFMVQLRFGSYHSCGGTLIHPEWVLTAGHCITTPGSVNLIHTYQMSVEIWSDKSNIVVEGQVTARIKKFWIHPEYKLGPYGIPFNDIALIQLRPYDTNGREIITGCIPETPFGVSHIKDCITAGWGLTKGSKEGGETSPMLKLAHRNIISKQECRSSYGKATHPLLNNDVICTRHPRSTVCSGDSGSPMQCRSASQQRWEIHGVTSFAGVNCNVNTVDVFTKVANYRHWILRTMGAPTTGTDPPHIPHSGALSNGIVEVSPSQFCWLGCSLLLLYSNKFVYGSSLLVEND